MIKKSKIVVLLSTYNGEKFIKRQIQSIINQDIKESIDIIIRDDGSSDETVSILEKLSKENGNILLIKGDNIGVVGSFLSLLSLAHEKGYEFYCFSDQDDFWLPNKISSAIDNLKNYDNAEPLFYGNRSKIVDENLNDLGQMTQDKKHEITLFNTVIQNICPGHGQVINRKLAEVILLNTKDDERIYSQDLWIINVAATCGKVIFDEVPHTLYVMHQENKLGFGKSKFDWLVQHIKRMKENEVKKMSVQLLYFYRCYADYIEEDYKSEIIAFINSQGSFYRRLKYIVKSKLYRQRKYETILFKIMYAVGKYNVS